MGEDRERVEGDRDTEEVVGKHGGGEGVLFFSSTSKGLSMTKTTNKQGIDGEKKAKVLELLRKSKEKVDANGVVLPKKLWLTVFDTAAGGEHLANPVRMLSGLYLLADGRMVNGQHVWEQAGGRAWIESNKKGHWAVTRDTGDVLVSVVPHNGKLPHETETYRSKYYKAQREREREAALECGNGVWAGQDKSGDAFITNTESKIHGFRYGRAVVASSDIKEEGELRIPLGCLGIVVGPSPHPQALRVKFDSFDAPFNVNHTELDLAEGPRVLVTLSNGDTVPGSVVNVSDDKVKIHYTGRLKTEDEWFDKDTEKIQPLLSDNPEGVMCCTESDCSSSDHGSNVDNIPLGRRGTFL